jgi:hypothetical protein
MEWMNNQLVRMKKETEFSLRASEKFQKPWDRHPVSSARISSVISRIGTIRPGHNTNKVQIWNFGAVT